MYQYTWFDKFNYTKDITLHGKRQKDWVLFSDISVIFPSVWEEHCLECSEPECYGSCPYWLKRFDEKCKKTSYGFKRRGTLLRYCPMAVQFKFRPWAKIQTAVYQGNVSGKRFRIMDRAGFVMDRVSFIISDLMSCILRNYKIGRAEEYFKIRYAAGIQGQAEPENFLFQCFSEEKEPYCMIFELLKDDKTVLRSASEIRPGYNQLLIEAGHAKVSSGGKVQMRYYPENDREAEILVLFSDFICLKKHRLAPAKKVKCAAWDLDNTIWDGILLESNPDSLNLRPGIADTIKALDERGIIQVIVSKNDETDVLPVLERLGIREYFIYVIAGWQRKSESLKAVAETLNININTFALIDDSEFERGEVKDRLPQVRVYTEKEADEILSLEPFQVPVTDDAKNRRRMYQEEAERKKIKMIFNGSDADFIKSCKMVIRITQAGEDTEKRCLELVQRTNQLNLSGKKYEAEGFHKLLDDHAGSCFAIFCRDRYGDYGQIGFMVINYDVRNQLLNISEYAMSCRVAEKCIEPALLSWMKEKWSVKQVVFCGVYNKKNDRLINTLKRYGMKENAETINTEASKRDRLMLVIDAKDIAYPDLIEVADETGKEIKDGR